MEQVPEQENPLRAKPPRKACQISIMWPCESDDEAMHVKKAIDELIKDIKEKRYTFNITEM